MASTIKLKNGSGAPLAGDLVQGEPALDLTNKRLYTEDSGGNVIEVGINPTTVTTGNITSSGTVSVDTIAEKTAANGVVVDGVTLKDGGITVTSDVAFGDNDKATFGASDDLQIFHDGSNSYIRDVGTGDLIVRATNLQLQRVDGAENYLTATQNGVVDIYCDGAVKLSTTLTGIDVTGTVTADGLTVDGIMEVSGTSTGLRIMETDTTDLNSYIRNSSGLFLVSTLNDAKSAVTNRFQITHNTGDISFYEDTGTTAKFFWDASAESLGIGTTSPSSPIHIVGASSANLTSLYNSGGGIRIHGGTTGSGNYTGAVTFAAATGTAGLAGVQDTSDADQLGLAFFTHSLVSGVAASEEAMRISSSGNVGIGTASPAFALDVDAVSAEFAARFTGTTTGYIRVNNDTGYADLGSTGNNMLLRTGGVERARIDSSGNLLVGTTASTLNLATSSGTFSGVAVDAVNDIVIATRASGHGLIVNRTGTDGDIAQFRKDGTTVGSIGSKFDDIVVGNSGTVGIRFDEGTGLVPWDMTANAAEDAQHDIGAPTARYKDLYLSGGVYLGGTGAANKLDDYEEGTFTPAFSGNLGVSGMAYSTQTGYYTKVGDTVTVHINLAVSTLGTLSGTYVLITGLPFVASVSAQGSISYFVNVNGHKPCVSAYMPASGSSVLVSATNSTNDDMTVGNFPVASITATTQLNVSITYKTSA